MSWRGGRIGFLASIISQLAILAVTIAVYLSDHHPGHAWGLKLGICALQAGGAVHLARFERHARIQEQRAEGLSTADRDLERRKFRGGRAFVLALVPLLSFCIAYFSIPVTMCM